MSNKQNDIFYENLQELEKPIQWQTGRANRWTNWLLWGSNRKTGKEEFEESRVPVFPEKGLNKLDYNKI